MATAFFCLVGRAQGMKARGREAVKPLGQPGHRRKREICPRWRCLKGIPLRKSLKMNEEPLGNVTGLLLRNIGFRTEEPVPASDIGGHSQEDRL